MQYKNQFADVPESERCRTTIEIPRRTEAAIKHYEPKTGVIQTTVSLLVTKLTDELTKSNLTAGDRYSYQDAIANLEVRLPAKYYTNPPATGDSSERVALVKPTTRQKRNSTKQAVSGHD